MAPYSLISRIWLCNEDGTRLGEGNMIIPNVPYSHSSRSEFGYAQRGSHSDAFRMALWQKT